MFKLHTIAFPAIITAALAATAPTHAAQPEAAALNAAASGADRVETKEKRYCLLFDLTGSRTPRKSCKTKAQWAQKGVDVDRLK